MPNNTKLVLSKPENTQKKVVRRDIYFFVCKICGNERRQSLKAKRAGERICAKCRRNQPDPNQESLFGGVSVEQAAKGLKELAKVGGTIKL